MYLPLFRIPYLIWNMYKFNVKDKILETWHVNLWGYRAMVQNHISGCNSHIKQLYLLLQPSFEFWGTWQMLDKIILHLKQIACILDAKNLKFWKMSRRNIILKNCQFFYLFTLIKPTLVFSHHYKLNTRIINT